MVSDSTFCSNLTYCDTAPTVFSVHLNYLLHGERSGPSKVNSFAGVILL
jgi:hypothetical protein